MSITTKNKFPSLSVESLSRPPFKIKMSTLSADQDEVVIED